jgi:hypothetical protein
MTNETKKNTKAMKRLVRELQELRGCSYGVALNELRNLPEGTWKEHIMKVALEPTDAEDPR